MKGPQKIQDLNNNRGTEQSLWKLNNGSYVVVSRILAFDHGGWETMIFHATARGEISTYSELYTSREYETHAESMAKFTADYTV